MVIHATTRSKIQYCTVLYLVQDLWSKVHDPWYLVLGPWPKVLSSKETIIQECRMIISDQHDKNYHPKKTIILLHGEACFQIAF